MASISTYCQNNATFIGDYDDNEKLAGDSKCGGTERWKIKVLADVDTAIVNYFPLPTTIDSLINIQVDTLTPDNPRQDFEFQPLRAD